MFREFSPLEKERRAYSFCGTIEYMAPEVVMGGNHGHNVVSWLFLLKILLTFLFK